MQHFINIIVLCLTLISSVAYGQFYTFKKYNHRSGLNTIATLSTAQDDKGYIWIGTDGGGLMQFNGHNFYEIGNFSSNNALHVSSIFPISHNHVVFGSLYDGVYELKNNKYQLIYKPIAVGDLRNVTIVESNYSFFSDYEIQLVSSSKKLIQKVRFKKEFFKLKQAIKIPNAVIYLTNQGDFVVTKKKIIKLTNWLKGEKLPSTIEFATYDKNRLKLFHSNQTKYTSISLSTFGAPLNAKEVSIKNTTAVDGKINLVYDRFGLAFIQTDLGKLYKFENNQIKHIPNNSNDEFTSIYGLFIDKDKTFWINSIQGVFKISKEPFTKIAGFNITNSYGVGMIHHVRSTGYDLVATYKEGLLIGSISKNIPFKKTNLNAYGTSESKDGIFIATNKGIYQYKDNKIVDAHFPYVEGKSCTMIFHDGEEFWYSAAGQGVCRFNLKTKKATHYPPTADNFSKYFYNAQTDFTRNKIYLGGNIGILVFDKKTEKFTQLSRFNAYGSYCGNSVKDKFGTLWFTLDKALVGITKSEDYIVISDKKKLVSTLMYTLNSDKYGNLLLGTNKGINVLRVDGNGNVLSQCNYSHFEGFDGYETNMRACYQDDEHIFVGTIEGLFEINAELLELFPAPPTPIITKPYINDMSKVYNTHKLNIYSFSCILPMSRGISYSYRILGYSNKWSDLTKSSEISLPELDNGEYTLQVRATYDGTHFSGIATEKINVVLPLLKNKWFLVFIVVLLGIMNLVFFEWSKNFKSNTTIDSNILTLDVRLIPKIILYCGIASIGLPILINTVQSDFRIPTELIVAQSALIFILFAISRYAEQKLRQLPLILFTAYATYGVLILGSFYLIFATNIEPYSVIQLCILISAKPFLFSKIRIVIFTSVAQIVISICLIIVLNETAYNEVLFLIVVLIASALVVIFSFVRLDSLDKLIFVNGIVNRGNVISISFDEDNIITYCSTNINKVFNFESEIIIGNPTSIFNDIIQDEELRESKITQLFVDGKSINIPMVNKTGQLRWFEWACKELGPNVKVIMGQDITEKLLISNNYQSLVENAKDLIFNTDINGNFLFVNEFTKKILGYREESLIGTNSLNLIVPEYQEYVQNFYTEQFKNRNKYSYLEYPIRNKAGKVFWLGQNLTLVYEPGSRDRVSGFMVLSRDITARRANDLLLEQQNKEISQSINAAKRIQSNLLPKATEFSKYFHENFILFKPKEVVSGDFYWIERIEDKVIVAVSDCLGHGISGAFLTILGYNLLNQIVLERKIQTPDGIIAEMNISIQKAIKTQTLDLKQRAMDMLVMVFNKNGLSFSSNGVNLIYTSNGVLSNYKNTFSEDKSKLETRNVKLEPSDTLYMLSDGYQKQRGSLQAKKFGAVRLEEFIQNIHSESLVLQKKHFENTLRNWSEGHDQTGDITVIALRNFQLPV